MKTRYGALIAIFCLFGFTIAAVADGAPSAASTTGSFALLSPAFAPGGTIPAIYTCGGENISPPLKWSNVPAGAKSLALVVDDPDAPIGDFIHWVIFNIPADATGLTEALSAGALPAGAIEGENDFHQSGYGGPCPPPGKPHRYFFTLFAVDTVLSLPTGITKATLMNALTDHVVARAQLMGKFKRSR